MDKIEKTVELSKETVKRWSELKDLRHMLPDYEESEEIDEIRVQFTDEKFAVIELVNSECGPSIHPFMFEYRYDLDGYGIYEYDMPDQVFEILGDYVFNADRDQDEDDPEYILHVVEKS